MPYAQIRIPTPTGYSELYDAEPYRGERSPSFEAWDGLWIPALGIRVNTTDYGKQIDFEGVPYLKSRHSDGAIRRLYPRDSEGTELKVGDEVALGGKTCHRATIVGIGTKMVSVVGGTYWGLPVKLRFSNPETNAGRVKEIKDTSMILRIGPPQRK